MAENNIHDGHRKRMMKRYRENGIECFETHEMLEILLYSVFPRANTNDISHRLLETFGTLDGVLSASVEELATVDGVGEAAACKIRFLGDFFRYRELPRAENVILDSPEAVRKYCSGIKAGVREYGAVLFLDNSHRLVMTHIIRDCFYDYLQVSVRDLVLKAVLSRCEYVIMVHSHPENAALASSADISSTKRLAAALKAVGVTLDDHLIIGSESMTSMREMGLFK